MLRPYDTAGQEDYPTLRPLTYPQTDVFLIMFSIVSRFSFTNVRTLWAPEIEEHAPGVPTILVGLKRALRNDPDIVKGLKALRTSPVRPSEGLQMAKDIGAVDYVECDALTGENIHMPFEKVRDCCAVLPGTWCLWFTGNRCGVTPTTS